MNKKLKIIIKLCLALIPIISLTACGAISPTTPAAPTIDPNLIYTQAAQTVAAQLTSIATPVPPTAAPTKPPAPTQPPQMAWPTPAQPGSELTPGAMPGQPAALPFANTQAPIMPANSTQPATEPTKADKLDTKMYSAKFTGQRPGDGYRIPPGVLFDAVFEFENNGDAEWTPLYSVRWYQGEKFGLDKTKFTLDAYGVNTMTGGKTAKKGERVRFTINGLRAPLAEGQYSSFWRLCNNRDAEGKSYQCFYLMTIQIVVK